MCIRDRFSCIEIGAVLLVVIREFNDVLDIPSESKGKSTLEIERYILSPN